MKGIKAIYQSLEGPIHVRAFAIIPDHSGTPLIVCKVTSRNLKAWPRGLQFEALPIHIFETVSFWKRTAKWRYKDKPSAITQAVQKVGQTRHLILL